MILSNYIIIIKQLKLNTFAFEDTFHEMRCIFYVFSVICMHLHDVSKLALENVRLFLFKYILIFQIMNIYAHKYT